MTSCLARELRRLEFIVPGELDTATGGYGYDRRLITELERLGWRIRVHSLDGSFPDPTPGARRHAAAVLRSFPDRALVLIDGLAAGALPQALTAQAARLKLIGLVHHPLAEESGLSASRVQRLRASERLALTAMRRVAVTSRATARALRAYGVPRARLAVLEPGTDRPAAAARTRNAPRGAPGRRMELLCVASLIPRKGHDLVLRALASLRARPWHLICAGSLTRSVSTVRRFEAQLRRYRLEERVTLTGELRAPELARHYRRADLFVLATRYEGYGMAVAEALAHGVPVISTRTGAIPQLVGRRAGLVVAPGNAPALKAALERVLRRPALHAALRRGARQAGRALPSWRELGRSWSALLTQVATSAR